MRRLIVLGIALGMVACGGEDATIAPPQAPAPPAPPAAAAEPQAAAAATAETPTPAPSMTDKELATIKAYFETLNAHDSAKYAALYAPNTLLTIAGQPDWKGRDAVQTEQQKIFDQFGDVKWGARRIFLKDDVAIVEWVGVTPGVPDKAKHLSKPVGVNGVSVIWFTPDGLVKEEHDYYDQPTIAAQATGGAKGKAREVATLPTGAPEVHIAKGTADEAKNVEAAKAVAKAFEAHDEKVFGDANSDEIVWEDYTMPTTSKGKADALKMFQSVTKAFPDLKMTCTVWGIEDVVAQECTMNGTNKGPLVGPGMKLPATNKTVTMHGVDVIQLKDGKAVKGWSYGNGMEMATQLGLAPRPKATPPAKAADTTKKGGTDAAKAPKK